MILRAESRWRTTDKEYHRDHNKIIAGEEGGGMTAVCDEPECYCKIFLQKDEVRCVII